jgi:hypothetical protein
MFSRASFAPQKGQVLQIRTLPQNVGGLETQATLFYRSSAAPQRYRA